MHEASTSGLLSTYRPSAMPLRLRNQCDGHAIAMLNTMPIPIPINRPGKPQSELAASQSDCSYSP
jgi:hypothetical protein